MDPKDAINDTRYSFKHSFSGFTRANVKNEFSQCILNDKFDLAIMWAAELLCAGHARDIWDVIFTVMSQNINLGNTKLPIYINIRYQLFGTIMRNLDNDLDARNNIKIREYLLEVVYIICTSKKRPPLQIVRLPEEAFQMQSISVSLQAPSSTYITGIFRTSDPKELFIPTNELGYHLKENNMLKTCYWLEWIIQYQQRCTRNKVICKCATRTIPSYIADKYSQDMGWLIWEVIRKESSRRSPPLIEKIIEALYELYCIRYTSQSIKKNRFMLYHACHLLTEHVDLTLPIVPNSKSLNKVLTKVNDVYHQLKKREVQDSTHYLSL